MRKSCSLFKYLLCKCGKDHLHRGDSIAVSLMSSNGGQNSADFWKKVKNVTNFKVPLPETLEGITGTENRAKFLERSL